MEGFTAVPNSAIACMAVEVVLAFILPLAAVIIFKRKTKVSIVPFLVGAATFFVFAVVFEGLAHAVFLMLWQASADFLNSNYFAYALYGSFMAGIFEETGRYIAFKLTGKKYGEPKDAVAYGIGHGGFECMYVLGIGVASYIVMALLVNLGMGEMLFAGMGETDISAMVTVLESIGTTTPGLVFAAVAERISAMTIHVCNSVIVYNGVKNKKISRLFIAVGLHGAFNMIALMVNKYFGIAAAEVLLFAFAAALGYYVFKIKKGAI